MIINQFFDSNVTVKLLANGAKIYIIVNSIVHVNRLHTESLKDLASIGDWSENGCYNFSTEMPDFAHWKM